MTFRFICNNRDYTDTKVYDEISLQETDIQPIIKLFNHDVFSIDENGLHSITHSSVRNTSIPGILILKKNKTYGKFKNKFLYKCIPDDKRLPVFLVPYTMNVKDFSKKYTNKYAVFIYNNWDLKHPIGKITQIIGDVNIENNYYEYVLHCKCLNNSISYFNQSMNDRLKQKSVEQYFDSIIKSTKIDDRRHINVYTIDSSKTLDYDDAFSLTRTEGNGLILSVYIANVSVWLDVLCLWEAFSRRVSTIYLPDKKRPMLPVILSENLCSLKEGVDKIAFAMDVTIIDNNVTDISYSNCLINVKQNMVYEHESTLNNQDYIDTFNLVNTLNTNNKIMGKIKTSVDLVTYLMLLFNNSCANEMIKHKNGVYRATKGDAVTEVDKSAPEELSDFLTIWKSMSGEYTSFENLKPHCLLKFDNYIHITSPIRRLVDLLNITIIQKNLNMVDFTPSAIQFYTNWLNELEYINITMRSIRKIQYDCNLLHMCNHNSTIVEEIHKGYIFDKLIRDDGLFKYMVYLPDIKMVSPITLRDEITNYTQRDFRLYVVKDEDNIKRKIRIQLL
tara:strand:+ start:16814 stop:18490 length:1677 start_codon:yes stop_codon:yes gene_type:complete